MISKHTRRVKTFKKSYLAVSFEGKTYCPFDARTGCVLTTASRASDIGRGEEVLVLPVEGKDLLGLSMITVVADGCTETWKEWRDFSAKPEAPKARPVLVDVFTGRRYVGEPGEDSDNLFERLFS